MEPDFWHARWGEGRIGFHEGQPNAHLVNHLGIYTGKKRVFVPLCGKTEDLAYLAAQGFEVVGVELVETAVQAFFAEHGLTPVVTKVGPFVRYALGGITLFAGDFFATTRELLGPIDALFDRAAVIALPLTMRPDYVEHVRALMPEGAPGLVITVEYPQDQRGGPPFSVPEAELRTHYEGLSVIRVDEVLAEGPALTEVGAREKAFVVRF